MGCIYRQFDCFKLETIHLNETRGWDRVPPFIILLLDIIVDPAKIDEIRHSQDADVISAYEYTPLLGRRLRIPFQQPLTIGQ